MVLELSDFMIEHRFIILVDIIGYSELSDDQQVNIIESINDQTKEFINNGGYENDKIFSAFIPTGDGFYIIGDNVNSLFWGQVCIIFAVSLRNKVLDYIQSTGLKCEGIKIAIHYGTTKRFIDITDRENYTGSGMNETARLLTPKNQDEITEISKEFYDHNNTVVVSVEAFSKIDTNALKTLCKTEIFTLIVKHNKKINCRFVDTNKIYKLRKI